VTWRGKELLTEDEAIAQEAAGECCPLSDVLIPVARAELGAYVPPGRIRLPAAPRNMGFS